MFGELSYAWDLFGTSRLGEVTREMNLVQDIQFVHGDGGVGTIVLVSLAPASGFGQFKEKFTKIDNENRIKETEVVEGGFLNLGFSLYRIRFHIVEKEEATCTVKLTVEYAVKEEFAANASFVNLDLLVAMLKFAKAHLLNHKTKST